MIQPFGSATWDMAILWGNVAAFLTWFGPYVALILGILLFAFLLDKIMHLIGRQ